VPHRSRFASRLTLWAFAAALALKSAVPMLAAVAAGLQGKPVAEICDVYGVATTSLGGRGASAIVARAAVPMAHVHADAHGHAHGGTHGHMHGEATATAVAPAHGDSPAPDHRHGGQAGDHCALTGLVAIAATDPPALASLVGDDAPRVALPRARGVLRDAAARWAALLGHGPPAFS
jgi:hypothetical protein